MIYLVPQSEDDIKKCDMASYAHRLSNGTIDSRILHRVVDIGHDEQGTFYTFQGDNNLFPDDVKVRFADIRDVVVAVVY